MESCHRVGRCADLRLMAIDDVADYEAEGGLDAGCPPQAFPERGACKEAGGGGLARGCTHESFRTESDATPGLQLHPNECCRTSGVPPPYSAGRAFAQFGLAILRSV